MDETQLAELEKELKNKEREIILKKKENEINAKMALIEQTPFDFSKYKKPIVIGVIAVTIIIIAIRILMKI